MSNEQENQLTSEATKKSSKEPKGHKGSSGSSESKDTLKKQTFKEVKARNRYMYINNRYSIILATLATVALIVSVISFIYFLKQSVPPRYVPTDNEMRYFSPIPLSRHEKTDSDIQTFTMSTLKDLFAYDYINYQSQLSKSQDKFTDTGWANFVQSMKRSFTITNVQDNRWISTYRQIGLPRIASKGVGEDGVAYWLVETQGQIVYYGDSNRTDNVLIRMKIKRVTTLQKESGIGIEGFVFTIQN